MNISKSGSQPHRCLARIVAYMASFFSITMLVFCDGEVSLFPSTISIKSLYNSTKSSRFDRLCETRIRVIGSKKRDYTDVSLNHCLYVITFMPVYELFILCRDSSYGSGHCQQKNPSCSLQLACMHHARSTELMRGTHINLT